jgi:hypothetical protein
MSTWYPEREFVLAMRWPGSLHVLNRYTLCPPKYAEGLQLAPLKASDSHWFAFKELV